MLRARSRPLQAGTSAMLALATSGLLACPLAACSGSDGDRSSAAARPQTSTSRTRPGTERAAPEAEPAEEPATQSRVWLEPPGREPVGVEVEVARTPAQTQRGLMFRRHMDPNAGMLFQFARPRQLTFWMHNTFIPLDMVFITSDMRVLGVVENATPETDDAREVEGISQYVLEVNAGYAREHGIAAGTMVRFENVPPAPSAGEDDEELEEEEE